LPFVLGGVLGATSLYGYYFFMYRSINSINTALKTSDVIIATNIFVINRVLKLCQS